MSKGHEPRDRPATRENSGETEVETAAGDEAGESRPRAELRWVQFREPKRALEIGRNGRVLDSFYHDGDDSWEVLLETYEGD
jgi:hypothetical protein